MNLIEGVKNTSYEIKSLPDNHLLRSLGLREGVKFRIQTRQPLSGPVVVKIGSRNIAIDYKVAKSIEIGVI